MEMVTSQLAEIGAKKDGKSKGLRGSCAWAGKSDPWIKNKEATIYLMMLGYVICLDY